MKKDEKKVITYIAYANMRDLKVVTDEKGNNVYSFLYDEIIFSEDKETVISFNARTIENVNEEYKNKLAKIVASDLNDLLSKETLIKEFVTKQEKTKEIEKKFNIKNLVVSDKQPKKSKLVRNTLIVGAVAAVIYFGGKFLANNNSNNEEPTNTDKVVEVAPEVFEEVIITKEMFVNKQNEVLSLLKEKGINGLDSESVASALFLFNLENFDQDVISELMNDRIIDDNMMETFEESFRLADTVAERNATIIENKSDLVSSNDLILTSNFIIGKSKDLRNIEYAENKLVELINSEDKEANTKLFEEAFKFILADSEHKYPYSFADTTESGKYALNTLTNYQLIRFSKDKLISEEVTDSMLTAPAYNDLSNIMKLYEKKCNAIQK